MNRYLLVGSQPESDGIPVGVPERKRSGVNDWSARVSLAQQGGGWCWGENVNGGTPLRVGYRKHVTSQSPILGGSTKRSEYAGRDELAL